MPPSNIPVPAAPATSRAMVASHWAPMRLHSSSDISSGIGCPAAASQIQPRTSVSHERYSNGPPCADFRRKVSR
ncbi:Uncharacterised protein [Mycobacterium tuberculosis]|nr:Uncharacterised protein [Mycobacterium tuberculosis]